MPFTIKFFMLALALVMYVLVIFAQNKKIVFTSIAALIVIVVALVSPKTIFPNVNTFSLLHIFFELVNWNVLMIYIGSMAIASLFIYSKMPEAIADRIVELSPSTGIAIVFILAMTGTISIFVENVATVLVMAPIALALSKNVKLNPTFFMIGLAVISNLEGTATLVGDPPSMIFASFAGYTFNDFFVHAGKISIFFFIQIGMIVGCLYFYAFFAKQKEKADLEATKIISAVPFTLLLLMIAGLAALSFLHIKFRFASGLFVLVLGVIAVLWFRFSQKKTAREIFQLIKGLDWETIIFLVGIFIVLGALSETGLLTDFAGFLAHATRGNKLAGFILIIVVSVFISGFVDNVPYIIVMLPVAKSLAVGLSLAPELYMFALLIGSCLGGNLTPFGASANIVAMGIVRKEGLSMNFAKWLQIAVPFTFITTAAASVALYLVWR